MGPVVETPKQSIPTLSASLKLRSIFGHYRLVAALSWSVLYRISATGTSSSDHNREVAALNSDCYRQVPLFRHNYIETIMGNSKLKTLELTFFECTSWSPTFTSKNPVIVGVFSPVCSGGGGGGGDDDNQVSDMHTYRKSKAYPTKFPSPFTSKGS